MKKYGSVIALAVVVVLAIVVVATNKKPVETVKAPYSIKKVENLERIEITEPGADGALVVLSLGSDGWELTKPVSAALVSRVSEQIAESLDDKINTDDITLDATKLEEFGLADDKARKIALFGKGATAPTAEFFLGASYSVPTTRAKRSYIKTTDGKVYRAQTDLANVLGKPVAELRSKEVQKLDRKGIAEIKILYQDATKNLVMVRDGESWKLSSPTVDFTLDRSATSGVLNGISNLIATGFVDGKQPADVGLDPWHVKIGARETGGELRSIVLSEVKDGKAYVKADNSPHIFEIAESTAKQLTVSPLSLRNRLVKDLTKEDVVRVDFAGEEKVVVEKKGEGWVFAKGGSGKVKETGLMNKVTALAQMRATRFETPDISTTGLGPKADKVTLTMKDGSKHTLLIGGQADEKGNLWGKWSDVELIMVIPQWIKERSTPTAAELVDEAS